MALTVVFILEISILDFLAAWSISVSQAHRVTPYSNLHSYRCIRMYDARHLPQQTFGLCCTVVSVLLDFVGYYCLHAGVHYTCLCCYHMYHEMILHEMIIIILVYLSNSTCCAMIKLVLPFCIVDFFKVT